MVDARHLTLVFIVRLEGTERKGGTAEARNTAWHQMLPLLVLVIQLCSQ